MQDGLNTTGTSGFAAGLVVDEVTDAVNVGVSFGVGFTGSGSGCGCGCGCGRGLCGRLFSISAI